MLTRIPTVVCNEYATCLVTNIGDVLAFGYSIYGCLGFVEGCVLGLPHIY